MAFEITSEELATAGQIVGANEHPDDPDLVIFEYVLPNGKRRYASCRRQLIDDFLGELEAEE